MAKYIFRRIIWMVPVLLAILAIMFLLMHSIPGNPWDSGPGKKAFYNLQMDSITLRALEQRFGLDKSLGQQFVAYLIGRYDADGQFICGIVCGNLGPSYSRRGRTVQEVLFSRLQELGSSFQPVRLFLAVGRLCVYLRHVWRSFLWDYLCTQSKSNP